MNFIQNSYRCGLFDWPMHKMFSMSCFMGMVFALRVGHDRTPKHQGVHRGHDGSGLLRTHREISVESHSSHGGYY